MNSLLIARNTEITHLQYQLRVLTDEAEAVNSTIYEIEIKQAAVKHQLEQRIIQLLDENTNLLIKNIKLEREINNERLLFK